MVDTATTKAVPAAAAHATRQGYWRGVLRRLLRDPGGVVVGVVILLLALALFGPWLIVKDPYQNVDNLRLKPHRQRRLPAGASDELGRDMLSRLMAPDCRCLWELSVVFAFYRRGHRDYRHSNAGGKTNTVIMRTVDVFYAFPSVLLAIALSGALGAGIGNALLSLTLVFVPQVARIAERDRPGAAYGLYRRRPGHWRQRVDHYPRPGVGQRARADLRLLHRADFGA